MKEEILAMVKQLTGAHEEEWPYLETLCAAEENRLRRRIDREVDESLRGSFLCAAAWLAAADYFCARCALGGAASWSAGDVSVKEKDAAAMATAAENLRAAAEHLLQGALTDENFAFRGVRG